MVSGKSVIARMMVQTHTAQSTRSLARLKMSWVALQATAVSATKMMILAIGHIAAVGGAFFAVTMILKDYESALVRAGAIGGLTTTQTALLSAKLMASAAKYGAASTEMADGVLELTKAGFEFADVMAVIDTITKVNIANNLDYASSATISTLVMKAFKVEAADLEKHFDKLQYVVNKTLMDMGDFIELLRYAGSTAITAQVEPEKLYAMAGALSDVAQSAGIGARGINRMMIEMLKEVDAVQKWSDALGLNIEILKDGTLNIHEIIKAFSELGMSEEFLLTSMERFSIRSARAWLGLMINAEEYFELVEGQKGAANYLNDVVGPQLDTLTVRLARLKATMLEALRTPEFMVATKRAFDSLEDSVTSLIPVLRELLLDLLSQAPGMLEMLFNVVNSLLPLLINGLLPIFATFAKVLGVISGRNGLLFRLLISMMLINKFTPGLVRSLTLLMHAWRGVALTTLHAQQAIGGIIFGLVLIMSTSKGIERALYVITVGVVALTAALAAMKAVGGDIGAGIRGAAIGAAAAASLLGMVALTRASTKEVAEFDASTIAKQRGEVTEVIGSYQSGTRYVPRTGPYILHEGEPVGTRTSGVFDRTKQVQAIIINKGTIYGDENALRELIKRVMMEETEEAAT